MTKQEKDKLEKYLQKYFKDIHAIYTSGEAREESYYPAFKELIESCAKLFQTQANVLVLPK